MHNLDARNVSVSGEACATETRWKENKASVDAETNTRLLVDRCSLTVTGIHQRYTREAEYPRLTVSDDEPEPEPGPETEQKKKARLRQAGEDLRAHKASIGVVRVAIPAML